jgi:hypothetical protein
LTLRQIAKSRGFRYAHQQGADLPLADILGRVEALGWEILKFETAASLAQLRSYMTIGMALQAYWPISRDRRYQKWDNYRWVNPEESIETSSNVVGSDYRT